MTTPLRQIRVTRLFFAAIVVVTFVSTLFTSAYASDNTRMIVLTDIEADPDDTQTLVRLLVYANVIDIKGLVATTSVHQKSNIAPAVDFSVGWNQHAGTSAS